ncbi:MAG: hypothetical protein AB7O86_14530 [Porticoccaceae bacterium]
MTTMFCVDKALTKGIVERAGKVAGSYFYYRFNSYNGKCVLIGKTAFPTRADAVAAAEKMRLRKIEAVKRQLAKLEALRFE